MKDIKCVYNKEGGHYVAHLNIDVSSFGGTLCFNGNTTLACCRRVKSVFEKISNINRFVPG
jgi:hypothetical protein